MNHWKGGDHESDKRYRRNNPWAVSCYHARERCFPSGAYGKRGIKFLMTIKDFKFLWLRDNAASMKRPSIDRIDTNGDYRLENCRFIALKSNMKRTRGSVLNILKEWDDKKTLKESAEYFNQKYGAVQMLAYRYKLKYKRATRGIADKDIVELDQ